MLKKLVIIPTYNELGNIQNILLAIFALEDKFEVLVVDDGSPDGTAQVVKKMFGDFPGRLHILERACKLGLGTAYIAGFRWGLERKYDFIFEMDADFSHHPSALPHLLRELEKEEVGMVVGLRYISGGKVENWPWHRVLLSFFASVYVRIILWLSVNDTTAGFVGYRKEVLEEMDLDQIEFVGDAFQIEMKYATTLLGYKISEVPITFRDRQVGTSKMSTAIFSEAFLGVWKMRKKSFAKSAYRKNVY